MYIIKNIWDYIASIRDQIAKGKIDGALSSLRGSILSHYRHFQNEIDLISNRFSRVKEDSRKGIISQESKNILLNRITNDVLELTSKIETQEKSKIYLATYRKKFKFFLYVSHTKVNMLFEQIDYNEPSKFSIYQKVKIVVDYLNGSNQVGNFNENKSYVFGRHKMNWGYWHDYASGIAFFGYKESEKKIALIGSKSSMIGEIDANEIHSIDHYFYRYLNAALSNFENNPEKEKDTGFKNLRFSFDLFYENVKNKNQELEYIAKVINTYEEDGSSIIIGSPIYISLEE